MNVDCIDVYYQPGSYDVVQGVKKGTPERYDKHGHFQARGHGYGQITTKSDMVLVIEADQLEGRIAYVSLGDFFKDYWGNLSPQRQTAIINTKPASIEVQQKNYASGEFYYEADQAALLAWLERAKADQVRARNNRKKMAAEINAKQKLKQALLFDE